MASTTASTTTTYKSSEQLRTKKPSSKEIASSLPDATFNASEERYWVEKFGLGSSEKPTQKYAHFRQVKLEAGSSSIVHQLLFAPGGFKSTLPLATVCGPRVQLYGTTPQSSIHRLLARHSVPENYKETRVEHDRQVQTGGHLALSASFRSDGRLLAVGTDNGQVRVADTTSRATLCTWQNSSRLPIRAVHWFRDGQHVLACGDDGLVSVWSLKQNQVGSSSGPKVKCAGHGDSIRSACLWQLPAKSSASLPFSSLAATGSYDHTVRLWNLDSVALDEGGSVDEGTICHAVLHHDSPVEVVMCVSSSDRTIPMWILSAGGTTIKVWNPLSGQCVHTEHTHHRKAITSLLPIPRKDLSSSKDGISLHTRILSGGIDGLIRIHSWDSSRGKLAFLHGVNMHSAVTAMAATPNADRLAIACIDGTVHVRQRGPSLIDHKRKRSPPGGTYAFFTRGMNVDAVADDFVVTSGKKRKLQKFDLALKQFRYGDALDESLETRNPQIVVSVLEELGKRQGLSIALSNRDEESLEPILSFTVRYITRPRFSALLVGVANKLIDIYGNVTGQSETIDELFAKLQNQVAGECRAQKQLMRVLGQIDCILAAGRNEIEER